MRESFFSVRHHSAANRDAPWRRKRRRVPAGQMDQETRSSPSRRHFKQTNICGSSRFWIVSMERAFGLCNTLVDTSWVYLSFLLKTYRKVYSMTEQMKRNVFSWLVCRHWWIVRWWWPIKNWFLSGTDVGTHPSRFLFFLSDTHTHIHTERPFLWIMPIRLDNRVRATSVTSRNAPTSWLHYLSCWSAEMMRMDLGMMINQVHSNVLPLQIKIASREKYGAEEKLKMMWTMEREAKKKLMTIQTDWHWLVARWSSGKCIVWLPRRYGYPIVVDHQAKEKKIGNQSAQTVYHDWQFGSDCITSLEKFEKERSHPFAVTSEEDVFSLAQRSPESFLYIFLLPLSIASVEQGSDWVARHPRRCFLSKGGRHV